jgi:hypothetical protein
MENLYDDCQLYGVDSKRSPPDYKSREICYMKLLSSQGKRRNSIHRFNEERREGDKGMKGIYQRKKVKGRSRTKYERNNYPLNFEGRFL